MTDETLEALYIRNKTFKLESKCLLSKSWFFYFIGHEIFDKSSSSTLILGFLHLSTVNRKTSLISS